MCEHQAMTDAITKAPMLYTFAALLLLAGCAQSPDELNQKARRGFLRHQYFVECMKLLPAGPVTTRYNDWDEVVSACDTAAYYQSIQAVP